MRIYMAENAITIVRSFLWIYEHDVTKTLYESMGCQRAEGPISRDVPFRALDGKHCMGIDQGITDQSGTILGPLLHP